MTSHGSTDPDCIFCKIVRGDVPASKILETGDAVAFLDVNPINHGHVLVIPKEHAPSLAELSDEQAAHLGSLLPRLCRAVRKSMAADGFNVVANGGRIAGQTIDHCHFHVIPRFDGDPVNWPWPQTRYQGDEMSAIRSRIEQELSASSS